jgi:hypothetical protein
MVLTSIDAKRIPANRRDDCASDRKPIYRHVGSFNIKSSRSILEKPYAVLGPQTSRAKEAF